MIRKIDIPIHVKYCYRDTALIVRDYDFHAEAPFRRVILSKWPGPRIILDKLLSSISRFWNKVNMPLPGDFSFPNQGFGVLAVGFDRAGALKNGFFAPYGSGVQAVMIAKLQIVYERFPRLTNAILL